MADKFKLDSISDELLLRQLSEILKGSRRVAVELVAHIGEVDRRRLFANLASRGDVEMIEYLVSEGADVTLLNREGQSTADMANGPMQRIQPFPEARICSYAWAR